MPHTKREVETEPRWLREQRQQALANYRQASLQKVRYGLGISAVLEGLDLEALFFAEETSISCADSRVSILPLKKALRTHEKMIRDSFERFLPEKNKTKQATKMDKMKLLHAAFRHTGFVVVVPDNLLVREPIIIDERLAWDKAETLIIHVGKNSSVTIIEKANSSDTEQRVKSQLLSLQLEEGSRVYYAQLQAYGLRTYSFSHCQAILGKNTLLQRLIATRGGAAAQLQSTLSLEGEGAEGKTISLLHGKNTYLFDSYEEHVHAMPRTTSNLIVRAVIDDKAKGIFRGLVKINEGARGCNGYLKEDALLLSEEAEADLVPHLEISNDEVRCRHGATVGRLDPEQVFYLTSRGISPEEAKRMLVEGFFERAIKEISNEKLQQAAREWLSKDGALPQAEMKTI